MFAVIVVVFFIFVTIESTAIIARYSGYIAGQISMGYSIHNAILSANRFFGFMIAPLIGFNVDRGMAASELYYLALICFLIGGMGQVLVLLSWGRFVHWLSCLLKTVKKNGYNFQAFISYPKVLRGTTHCSSTFTWSFKKRFVIPSAITTSLFISVSFILNLVAIHYFDYRATVLQMTGVVSGIGSLLLNFYTNPSLAVLEDDDNAHTAFRSIFIGKLLGIFLISPMAIVIFHFSL